MSSQPKTRHSAQNQIITPSTISSSQGYQMDSQPTPEGAKIAGNEFDDFPPASLVSANEGASKAVTSKLRVKSQAAPSKPSAKPALTSAVQLEIARAPVSGGGHPGAGFDVEMSFNQGGISHLRNQQTTSKETLNFASGQNIGGSDCTDEDQPRDLARYEETGKEPAPKRKPQRKFEQKILQKEQKHSLSANIGAAVQADAADQEQNELNQPANNKGFLYLLKAYDMLRFDEYIQQMQHEAEVAHRQAMCRASLLSKMPTDSCSDSSMSQPADVKSSNIAPADVCQPLIAEFDPVLQVLVDPITRKPLRRCANEICLYTSIGDELNFWQRRKLNGGSFSWLCKVCAEAYKKNQYCDFCKQIYFDGNSEVTDGKEWVQCEQCEKWNHIDCEKTTNDTPDLDKLLNNKDYKYFCLSCSKGKKPFKARVPASNLTLRTSSRRQPIDMVDSQTVEDASSSSVEIVEEVKAVPNDSSVELVVEDVVQPFSLGGNSLSSQKEDPAQQESLLKRLSTRCSINDSLLQTTAGSNSAESNSTQTQKRPVQTGTSRARRNAAKTAEASKRQEDEELLFGPSLH